MAMRSAVGGRFCLFALGACAVATIPTAVALDILVYATPVCASSHQLAMRRVAEALTKSGHRVTLVEPEAALERLGEPHLASSPERSRGSLQVWRVQVMADAEYAKRFQAGESFQSLSQEVNQQLLQQVHALSSNHTFQLAVVDALYPVLARELELVSVHVQCASDPDAISGAWFHYGLAGTREWTDVLRNLKFATLWLLSWLLVGTHQDSKSSVASLSWSQYYTTYVAGLLLQGTPRFSLPVDAKALVQAHPLRVAFVGSLTARQEAVPPNEIPNAVVARDQGLALVALGTKPNPCPLEILRALSEVDLHAIVLVRACEENVEVARNHTVPTSQDQAAWLKNERLRLVVVHGGIHSLHEAVGAGMPVACVPHEGDQWTNCRDLQRQHLGWAVHPRAPASEAAAAFHMLLEGRRWKERSTLASDALAKAGGADAVVHYVEQLFDGAFPEQQHTTGSKEGHFSPFFAAPFFWAEGLLFLLLVVLPFTLVGAMCFFLFVGPLSEQAKAKPE